MNITKFSKIINDFNIINKILEILNFEKYLKDYLKL